MASKLGANQVDAPVDFTFPANTRKMPFTLGIEGPDDTVIELIPKDAHLPQKKAQVFTADGSFQMSAYFNLVMGERRFASNNVRLCVVRFDQGAFRMAGKSRYELRIEVTGAGHIKVDASNLDSPKGPKPKVCFDNAKLDAALLAQVAKTADFADQDSQVVERFDFMAKTRAHVNDLAENYWPASKHKMSWGEKSGFKKCRRRIYALIASGPGNISDEEFAELAHIAQVELPKWEELLKERFEQVQQRYK